MSAIDDVLAGRRVRGDNAPLDFTRHAVERFRERSGREMTRAAVRGQLCKMIASMEISTEPPPWLRFGAPVNSIAYARLGDDVCMPVIIRDDALVATTMIPKDSITDETRERRRSAGRNDRSDKAARKRGAKKKSARRDSARGRRPDERPRRKDWRLDD